MATVRQQRRLSPGAAVVLFVFALLLVGATVWLLRLPIQLFIIAVLVALAISHPVDWLEQRRVPRIAAIIAMLLAVIAVIGIVAAIFLPPLTRQTAELIEHLPGYWGELQSRLKEVTQSYPWIQERIAAADLSKEVTRRAESVLATGWSFARGLAGGLVMAILLLITIVFMLADPRPLINGILGVVPEPWAVRAREIGILLAERIRAWLRGVIILGSIIGVAVGVGLWFLGVPYAVLFGVLAGVLEAVPTVGPILAAIPPILVALAAEPIKALWVALLFLVVQQVENTLLVPYIMSRQLQLHPVSIIFGFIALGTLFGVFGAIVAVPTMACLKVLYDEIYYPWAHPGSRQETPTESPPAEAAQEAEPEGQPPQQEPPQEA